MGETINSFDGKITTVTNYNSAKNTIQEPGGALDTAVLIILVKKKFCR